MKPENILIDTDGSLVVADFGLSKYVEEQTRSKSFKGSGTIPYMAPEAWLGDKNTVSMDIYSLGIIFFEILAGALPITANSESEWREYHLYKQLPDIGKVRQDVPVKIRQILSKMTAKPIGERYKSVEEVSAALADAKTQFQQDEQAAEKLAGVAHQTLETFKMEKLKAEQLAEKISDYKKSLNYHITTVFEKTKEIVALVNARLEDKKIVVEEKQYTSDLRKRTLRLSFGQIALMFDFCDHDTIEEYDRQRIEQAKSMAMNQHGFIPFGIAPSFFNTRNVVFFGKGETNFTRSPMEGNYGFNLVLVKPDGDLYGKWWMAKFADTSFNRNTQRKNIGLDESYFLKEFELSFAMHLMSVEFRELTDQDLVNAIEEILKR